MDGTPFGRYRLLGSLGEGGMGQVFRAYDTATDREVALKVLAPHVAQDPTFEQRFRREAQVAARLSEPHIVPIHSYGAIDGRLYVDMRLIAGRDLGSVLEEAGAMNPVRAVGIIEQVADALDAAHSIDLVHRDIKPSNILLGRRDFVYLIDFGIAQEVNATRMTKTGAAIGTFAYMSPERIDSGQAASSSDIYSLACVLYECLTGQLPFPGDSIQQQIAGHLSKPVPRPSAVLAGIPRAFDEVITRGMAKNANERYPTVTAFAEAAREALDGTPGETAPHAMPAQFAPTQRATPVPGPVAPSPPEKEPFAPAPSHAAPASWGPPRAGDPPRLQGMSRDQQLLRPVNFVQPGILIMLFAGLTAIFAIWKLVRSKYGPGYFALDNAAIGMVFVYVLLWLSLAVAFGLVARKCRTERRTVAITAAFTSAAAVTGALRWGAVLLQKGAPDIVRAFPVLTFCAIIAFGLTAYRPFGLWWSVAALAAGLLGALGHFMSAPRYGGYTMVRDGVFQYYLSAGVPLGILLNMIWLVPLFILGIAMCRTRAGSQTPAS